MQRWCAHAHLIYVNSAAYVYMRRLYLCTHRPTAVGRASFVECGLILMGTDDKQRKQASSLPGEICLLLPGLQWGPIHARTHARRNDGDVGKDGYDDENYDQDVDLFQWTRKQYRALGSIGHTRPSSRALGAHHDRLLVTGTCKSGCSVLHRLPRLPLHAQMRTNEGELAGPSGCRPRG